MELRYQYQIILTLRRTRRKSIEYIPDTLAFGRRHFVIDLCDLLLGEVPAEEMLLDIIQGDLYDTKVVPFLEKEREKRAGVIVEKIIYDISDISVYEPESDSWIDIDDYLEEVVENDLC